MNEIRTRVNLKPSILDFKLFISQHDKQHSLQSHSEAEKHW